MLQGTLENTPETTDPHCKAISLKMGLLGLTTIILLATLEFLNLLHQTWEPHSSPVWLLFRGFNESMNYIFLAQKKKKDWGLVRKEERKR